MLTGGIAHARCLRAAIGTREAGINQTQNAGTSSGGTWVKLGEWQFNAAVTGQQVSLNPAGSTGAAGSVVVASAVEAVRDTTGITNTAVHGDSYSYDLDGNTTAITGTAGTGAGDTAVTIAITPDVLDRTSSVTEAQAPLQGAVPVGFHNRAYVADLRVRQSGWSADWQDCGLVVVRMLYLMSLG